ncbi:MAG: flavodoxin-dependent (E)-4-hydroxy-3-methylbut-2-enyl-diphosphate synthase, partial [Ruminococcaceae bacterium]|nr:flavodoxin-dependent (E)-4-hydroxy-3-methylbut-2-enyl-diphosphate synthase [Oscillospiraceae bacterium]
MTKKIKLGNTYLGGGEPVLVQSMLNIPASDIEGNVRQAVELEKAGCQVIRFAIPDENALALVEPIKKAVSVPLVADIHF